MWCNETFACRPHLSLQRETSNDNDIYETPRQTSVMDQWLWLRYCCICAVKFFQNQNKCFGAQCFCKPSQKPWAFLNFPCAVLVMAIQLSKRLFGLPWKKQESSFQKVQQRFQVFAWLPSRCQFLELHGDLNPPICWTPWDLDALRKKLTARQFPVLNWTPAAQVCEGIPGIPVLPAKPWDAVFFYQGKTTGKKDRFVGCNLQGKQLRRDSYSYTLNVPNAQGFM